MINPSPGERDRWSRQKTHTEAKPDPSPTLMSVISYLLITPDWFMAIVRISGVARLSRSQFQEKLDTSCEEALPCA